MYTGIRQLCRDKTVCWKTKRHKSIVLKTILIRLVWCCFYIYLQIIWVPCIFHWICDTQYSHVLSFKQWWPLIPPISTKWTITSYLNNWAHWTQKIPQYMMLEIQVLAWDGHINVAGLNRLMGSQPSPLDNWISNGNTFINKR